MEKNLIGVPGSADFEKTANASAPILATRTVPERGAKGVRPRNRPNPTAPATAPRPTKNGGLISTSEPNPTAPRIIPPTCGRRSNSNTRKPFPTAPTKNQLSLGPVTRQP